MELSTTANTTGNAAEQERYKLEFLGNGADYFKIMIVNWLFTLLTLGLYYPWARAKKLKYIYGQTALNDERFHFSGDGKEMFKGFIKVLLFYVGVLVLYFVTAAVFQSPLLAVLFLYLGLLALLPFAIHGSLKYRMSRSSYRGIRFGYRGNRNELIKIVAEGVLFTVLSFGIYGAWLQMNIRRYTHQHIRYGDIAFSNDANGGAWFILNIKGYLLSVFTLGIYTFWWQRDIFRYYIDNMKMQRGEEEIQWKSIARGEDFLSLLVGNFFLVLLTLGFGTAWAEMRTQRFICDYILLKGNIKLHEIEQTEEEYRNAFGEEAMDFFEFDLA